MGIGLISGIIIAAIIIITSVAIDRYTPLNRLVRDTVKKQYRRTSRIKGIITLSDLETLWTPDELRYKYGMVIEDDKLIDHTGTNVRYVFSERYSTAQWRFGHRHGFTKVD